jgi:hypothetical protein
MAKVRDRFRHRKSHRRTFALYRFVGVARLVEAYLQVKVNQQRDKKRCNRCRFKNPSYG